MASAAQIKKKINDKIYQIKDIRQAFEKSKRKFQSTVWNNFNAIVDDKNEVIEHFVCCKYCKDVLKCTVVYEAGKDFGTSNLRRHIAVCKAKKQVISKGKKRK